MCARLPSLWRTSISALAYTLLGEAMCSIHSLCFWENENASSWLSVFPHDVFRRHVHTVWSAFCHKTKEEVLRCCYNNLAPATATSEDQHTTQHPSPWTMSRKIRAKNQSRIEPYLRGKKLRAASPRNMRIKRVKRSSVRAQQGRRKY